MFDLEQKIIVITGVSGQMGNEYATFFIEQDSIVVGLDIVSIKIKSCQKTIITYLLKQILPQKNP